MVCQLQSHAVTEPRNKAKHVLLVSMLKLSLIDLDTTQLHRSSSSEFMPLTYLLFSEAKILSTL